MHEERNVSDPGVSGLVAAMVTAVVLLCGPGVAASKADTTYSYDDGVSNVTLGPPGSFAQYGNIDMLWGNYFFTATPQEAVTEITFGLGDLSAGGNCSVWVFNDPDDDGDPANAVPIFNVDAVAYDLGFDFNVLPITPTVVDGGFFVAVGHLAELTYDEQGPQYPHPGRFDPDGRADRSWFFYDDDIPENNLATSGFVQRMDGPYVPIQGAFAVRATTTVVPEPTSALLVAFAALGIQRLRPNRR